MKKTFEMCFLLLAFMLGFNLPICQANGECILGYIKLGSDKSEVDKIYGASVCVDSSKNIYRYGDSLYVAYTSSKIKDVISTANNGIKTGSGLSVGDPLSKFTSTFSGGTRTSIVNNKDVTIGYAYTSGFWKNDYIALPKAQATLILMFDPQTQKITRIHTSFRYPNIQKKQYLSTISGDRPTANTPFDGMGFYRIIEQANPNNLPYGGGNLTQAPFSKSPSNPAEYNQRGLNYAKQGQYDKAILDFSQAIVRNPQFALAYANRGLCYYRKGEYDKAIADYNQAIMLNSKNAIDYSNRGLAYDRKGEYDKAIADYSQALRLNPKDPGAYYKRGRSYYEKGEYDKAIADYSQTIKLDPKDAAVYYNRGCSYYYIKQYDKAIEDYSQAINLNPKAPAYNMRGASYYYKEQYNKAIEDYSQAIKLNPQYADAYANRGEAYIAIGKYDMAINDLNYALKLEPDSKFAKETLQIALNKKQGK